MDRALRVLNRLVADGVLGRYAIGGAMAATFYAEPVATFDLDVFVVLPETPSGLVTLAPIYAALRGLGYAEEGECVDIEGVPVQLLPAYNALVEEAPREAVEVEYLSVPTRVVRIEHLVAIALQTGRDKDRDRVRVLTRQPSVDRTYLMGLIGHHGLSERWQQWSL